MPSPLPYQCPGENHPISQSIHLARLANFYAACRDCPRRDETGSISRRQVVQLTKSADRAPAASLFHREGAVGTYLNDFAAADARGMAKAFGIVLRRTKTDRSAPQVVLAGDGRPITGELMAAAGEGLRFAGCDVIDIGYATAACLSYAIEHLQTDGGLLVSGTSGRPQDVGLKFWGAAGGPISAGGGLDAIRAIVTEPLNRPVRSSGRIRRFRADVNYLEGFEKYFHALRPLRIVLDTASAPLKNYLSKLSTHVACDLIVLGRQSSVSVPHDRATLDRLSERVRTSNAHFGIWIDGDGESCRLVDEAGRTVNSEHTLRNVVSQLSEETECRDVVLEEDSSRRLESVFVNNGLRVHRCASTRQAIHECILQTGALVAGGPSGRIWYRDPCPSADALKTVALLLTELSKSDRDLSEVLGTRF